MDKINNKSRKKIIDGMDAICEIKGAEAIKKNDYYNKYDFKKTDPQGSYTGIAEGDKYQRPIQDADDL